MMQRKKKTLKLYIIGLFILGMMLMNFTYSVFAINYGVGLTKGTKILIVNKYDETGWQNTVNTSSTPNDWLEGDADELGAQSKITIKGWNLVSWETYDVFISLFLPALFKSQDIIPLLMLMETQGYNETTINSNYTNSYNLWIGLRSVWNFTISDFEENPSNANDPLLILQYPTDIDDILNDYNNLSNKLNSNPIIQFEGYSFPILDSDEFLWLFIFNGFAVGTPSASYLEEFITTLNCQNATTNDNILIINRLGETIYTVEIAYGNEGTLSLFIVKDIGDNIIYQIVSTNSDWIFYMILILLTLCFGGLSVYLIFWKRRRNRMRKK
ncbi:MAG: hypothetical protein ACFFG0_16980 [Candidatus Thorarchaeota archaeon]